MTDQKAEAKYKGFKTFIIASIGKVSNLICLISRGGTKRFIELSKSSEKAPEDLRSQ